MLERVVSQQGGPAWLSTNSMYFHSMPSSILGLLGFEDVPIELLLQPLFA